MLTLLANRHLPTSAGNVDLCTKDSVLKVDVVAAAAELLRLAGESIDGVILLNGNDNEIFTAICKLKDDSSRARFSAAVKAVSVTDRLTSSASSRPSTPSGSTTLTASPAATRPRGRPSETASGLACASLPRLRTHRAL
jgi:hypothetical protein